MTVITISLSRCRVAECLFYSFSCSVHSSYCIGYICKKALRQLCRLISFKSRGLSRQTTLNAVLSALRSCFLYSKRAKKILQVFFFYFILIWSLEEKLTWNHALESVYSLKYFNFTPCPENGKADLSYLFMRNKENIVVVVVNAHTPTCWGGEVGGIT